MSIDVHIDRQVVAVQNVGAAMYLFGSFRASERKKLLAVAEGNKALFVEALGDFLERWAAADWLEEYNVERVGKWIAKSCSQDVQESVRKYVASQSPANATPEPATSVRMKTYEAFQKGISLIH